MTIHPERFFDFVEMLHSSAVFATRWS